MKIENTTTKTIVAACPRCGNTVTHAQVRVDDRGPQYECPSCGTFSREEDIRGADGRINRR